MNRVILVGRIATDPTFSGTQNGESARFRLAVRRFGQRSEGQPDADFFTIVVYGQRVQTVRNYFKKGMRIGVEGRLRSYTVTGNDGSRREVTDVVLDSFEFLSDREENNSHVPPPVTSAAPQNQPPAGQSSDYYPF